MSGNDIIHEKFRQGIYSCFINGTDEHTLGDCQRPVFLFGVSKHRHKIANLGKFWLKSFNI